MQLRMIFNPPEKYLTVSWAANGGGGSIERPYLGVSENGGTLKIPKMDGENNGKAYWNGWFGGKPLFSETSI